MDMRLLDTEFLRPMVTGWLQKIEAAETSRKEWRAVSDECHDDKTEVLTDRGWSLFCNLTGEESLATVNLATDSIEFQRPSEVTKRHFRGEMIRFHGKSLDAVVTPGHRMVRYSAHSDTADMREASDLVRSDLLKLVAENWEGTPPTLPDFLGEVSPADFAEWLGFYMAEGWCKSSGPRYEVQVAQKKELGRQYYESLSARMPFRTPPYREKEKCYSFSHKELWTYLKQFGSNCYDKEVPQWVKDSPQDVIHAFLRGYINGDGCVSNNGRQTVSGTASKRLADGIQELWIKVGRSASIRERAPAPYAIEDREGMSGVLYLVTAWRNSKRASLKRHNGSEIELMYGPQPYDGMVYCATVPNGTLITRRNGKPLISGNCLMFYSHSAKAMWDPVYGKKFWRNMKAPRFKITMNKAFEFVAIYGPNLFWDTPHREVDPKRPCDLPVEIFPGGAESEEYQQYQQIYQQEIGKDKAIASLLGKWLNYTPHEQPGGGLAEDGRMATIDALLEGRGCLWTELYTMPGSNRILTGSFRDDPRNLLTDPDYKSIHRAKWIARRKVMPTWEAERRYGLKRGSLSERASLESHWQYGESAGNANSGIYRASGLSNDMIVVWEIWSKMGPGCRKTQVPEMIKDHLESVVGDYCHIVVSPNVPYPLNMPTEEIKEATDDEVREAFAWPVPLWQDSRWPVNCLDLYIDTKSAWPIPPLSPGLGELKFLNAMVPWAANRIWSSSRDFWTVAQGHLNHLEQYLKEGDDQCVIPVKGGDDVRKLVQIMQQPETRADVWRIIDLVSELFDKRVGLTDFMYGKADTQDRSAETTRSRMSMIGIRPDDMRMRVKVWQSHVASSEAFLARMYISGAELVDLLGMVGATLWDQLVASTDIEKVMRQFSYTVSASSIQRPDRDKKAENAQQMMQIVGPIADGHATLTGDPTVLNLLLKKLGRSIDFDAEDLEFGPRTPPPPSEEEQQMMQQQQEMEMAKIQADLQLKQMDMEGKQIDSQGKEIVNQGKQIDVQTKQMLAEAKMAEQQADQEMKVQMSAVEMLIKSLEHQQELEQDDTEHVQGLVHTEQEHAQRMANEREMFLQRLKAEREKLKMQAKERKKTESKKKVAA